MVDGDEILAFGSTPDETSADFVRRCPIFDTFDGSSPEIHPCSPELYQLLQTEVGDRSFLARCNIDSNGVAVSGEVWLPPAR
jgi:hypothetical protein